MKIPLIAFVFLLIVGCSNRAQPRTIAVPTPTPTVATTLMPTPEELEAYRVWKRGGASPATSPAPDALLEEMKAQFQRNKAAREAAGAAAPVTPAYWPTFEDYQVAAHPQMSGPTLRDNRSYKDEAIESHRQIAGLYVALECLEGGKLSAEGFRKFATVAPGMVARPEVLAKDTIRRLLFRIESGSTSETCMGPYMYPESATELAVARDLIAAAVANTVPWELQPTFREIITNESYSWFQPEVAQGKPFLVWFSAERPSRRVSSAC